MDNVAMLLFSGFPGDVPGPGDYPGAPGMWLVGGGGGVENFSSAITYSWLVAPAASYAHDCRNTGPSPPLHPPPFRGTPGPDEEYLLFRKPRYQVIATSRLRLPLGRRWNDPHRLIPISTMLYIEGGQSTGGPLEVESGVGARTPPYLHVEPAHAAATAPPNIQ